MNARFLSFKRLILLLCLVSLIPLRLSAQGNRFELGTGTDPSYHSIVIGLDFQKGLTNQIVFNHTFYHLNGTNPPAPITNLANRIPFSSVLASFGSTYGGSPLYFNQDYHFMAYAGDPNFVPANSANAFLITAYDKHTFASLGTLIANIPPVTDTNGWTTFLNNGGTLTFGVSGLGLTATYYQDPIHAPVSGIVGEGGTRFPGAFNLTCSADSSASNCVFVVWMHGTTPDKGDMVLYDQTGWYWMPLFSLDFDARPPWRASFVDQPQFEGQPMPSIYQGKSVQELLATQAVVTNAVSSAATNWTDLDNSPELRQHPTLDQFVTDMGSNAMALAAYVQNNIELTDAIAYNDNTTNLAESAINAGGVNRSALDTFMEGQGSPVEQCALLVYLLRRAGVPAAYIYPPHDGVQMFDTKLSKLLRMQIHGAVNQTGQTFTTNTLISVNYPWVAAYINGQWVHLFPWLKDTQVTEGLNLWNYMPSGYDNAYLWVKHYLQNDTNIFSLNTNSDTLSVLFPAFIQHSLLTTGPGISVDDIGFKAFDRQVDYTRWTDFPTPTYVTNGAVSTVRDLTSITNIFPTWTNVFDTVSVQVFSTNHSIFTGDLRTADLHNRKLLIRHQTNGVNYDLILSLAPYRPSQTNLMNFTNDVALLNPQQLKVTLTTNEDSLTVRFTRKRHRTIPVSTGTNNYWASYLGYNDNLQIVTDSSMRLGDLAAVCLDSGGVSKKMLSVWAQEYWNMQQQVAANPSITNTLSPDITQGTLPYLMGMSYYERLTLYERQLEELMKVRFGTTEAAGLSKLSAKRDNNGHLIRPLNLYHPNVDMFFFEVNSFGNASLRPDSGSDLEQNGYDFERLLIAEVSAQEHAVVEDFYVKKGGISTVKLLRQSTNMLELNIDNYQQHASLATFDTGIWADVVGAFNSYPFATNYLNVFITGSPVSNSVAAYKGMGALITGSGLSGALISGNLLPQNGGWGAPLTDPIYSPPDYSFVNLVYTPATTADWSVVYQTPNITAPPTMQEMIDWYTIRMIYNDLTAGTVTYNGNQTQQIQVTNASGSLGIPPTNTFTDTANKGSGYSAHVGPARAQWGGILADPVNAITGEFYVDSTDLVLPGPFPIVLRRNYSSQDLELGDAPFGSGWRAGYQPYLRLVTNNVIFATEIDGTVVAYRQPTPGTNLWKANPNDNAQLNNASSAGVGSTANLFNNYITNVVVTGVTNYYLNGLDGSVRHFVYTNYPITGSTGDFDRARPYLRDWKDVNGNVNTYTYGSDNTQPDFGQVKRIQSSSGNFLGFYYDVYGHITKAYAGDGREVNYDYNQHGDLVTVTMPDESQVDYTYQLATTPTNSFSTHLLIREDKPDGRALANVYDSFRRVTNQSATIGNDLNLVTNATFTYSNNYTNFTNSLITGTTLVVDVFGRTNRFQYANSLITNIVDALNQTETQVWFSNTNDAGYYPHSLKSRTDKRNLKTDYLYDSFGNLIQETLTGNLTGGTASNETATYTYTYTSRNLLSTATDPMTNQVSCFYTNVTFPMSLTALVKSANGTPVSSNLFFYGNVSQAVTNGGLTTNSSFGLLQRAIIGNSATNDYTYDGRGFLTQRTGYTGTTDPAVTNILVCDSRGQLVEKDDTAGRKARFDYDAMGRLKAQEVFEAGQSIPLAWNYSYYNDNGDLTWTDGPRSNPEDYIWRDYDGAGRKITEIHWRSEAIPDGSGVQAASGDDQYATTFYQYDAFNNLIRVTDPLGNYSVMSYDALGRLTNEVAFSASGVALRTNTFGYEAGGQLSRYTNPLGGVSTRQYTYTGKLISAVNADGSTNGWQYYLDGRLRNVFLPNGNYIESIYNDANFTVTHYLHNASSILATNIAQSDARGNTIQITDANGNAWTNSFDGLNRIKVAAGPPTITVSGTSMNPSNPIYVTNILQQTSSFIYDGSGQVLTTVNGVGDKTITTSDALGRAIQVAVYPSNSVTPVSIGSADYSVDQQSVTFTNGSGSGAIVTTVYTDNDGNPVLTLDYPTNGITEYALQRYDRAGNRTAWQRLSSDGSTTTTWATNGWSYDSLNRVRIEMSRDGVGVTNAYDASGDLISRIMPGGLTWSATYLNSGLIASEGVTGGSLTARTNSYQYYTTGQAFAGFLQTFTDGRGTTRSYTYDDFLRLATMTTTGATEPQKTLTTFSYDSLGSLLSVSQAFNNPSTGPTTAVTRGYDACARVAGEGVTVGGNTLSSVEQGWDNAGRRSFLNGSGFGYRADGLMTVAGTSSFGYGDNGLLIGRTNASRSYVVNQRDGSGRILQTTTTGLSTLLTENLTYRNDGNVSSYTAARGDFTDNRSYSYSPLAQRLTSESFNTSGGQLVTNTYVIDQGQPRGLGILTSSAQSGSVSGTWSVPGSGGLDGLSRVVQGQNTLISRPATGLAVGAGTVSAKLDGKPVSVQFDGPNADGRWRANLSITPGSHTLIASAVDPSGQYAGSVTNSFTANGGATDSITNLYDGNGNITSRMWVSSTGVTNRIQALTWDAFDRLISVVDRDAQNSGFNWTGVYDGLGRRVQTVYTMVVSNTPILSPSNAVSTVDSWYDPQVEFLEIGVAVNGSLTTKTYGPDSSGVYGGAGGVGGLESLQLNGHISSIGVVQDYFGNVLASIQGGITTWNQTRMSSYGPLPGYDSPALSINVSLAQSLGWQGRRMDETGFVNMGARLYDPLAGRFMSTDPLGHFASMDLYSYCGGDPVNYLDPNGRCLETMGTFLYSGGSVGYNLRALGDSLENLDTDNPLLGADAAYSGAIVNELAAMSTPSTYVNGLRSYGHNVAGYYHDGGIIPASSYALVSWNVGAVYSGSANFDLHYDTAGQPIGDWFERGAVISGGVANTAGIAGGSLWGAAKMGIIPKAIPPVAPPAEVPPIRPVEPPPVRPVPTPPPLPTEAPAGKIIGLGLDEDLINLRGSGAITYKNGGWQRAGLTTVDVGRATESSWFRTSFKEAVQNAKAIRFDVSSFDAAYPKPGMTSWELNQIVNNSSLLGKTTFIQNGQRVIWNGTGFVPP